MRMSDTMDDALSEIVDQCLVYLADGATVNECLAAYPAWQSALEPPLRVAVRLRALPTAALPAVVHARLETQLRLLAVARGVVHSAALTPSAARGANATLAGVLRVLNHARLRLLAPLSRWLWR
jgi:hypothetical protein